MTNKNNDLICRKVNDMVGDAIKDHINSCYGIRNAKRIKMEYDGIEFPVTSVTIEDTLNSVYGMTRTNYTYDVDFHSEVPYVIGAALKAALHQGVHNPGSLKFKLSLGMELFIEDIIFQDDRTTIMIWSDGTKTVVKCSDKDTFSPEAGIALCFFKKFLGNDSKKFHKILKDSLNIAKFKYKKTTSDKHKNVDSPSKEIDKI